MQEKTADRSIGDLLGHLTQQIGSLVRQEITLAQTEMRQNAATMGRDMVMMIGGGILLWSGFIALLGTGIVALAQILPWWLAGLTAGGGIALIGLIVLVIGQAGLKRTNLMPQRTLKSLLTSNHEAHS